MPYDIDKDPWLCDIQVHVSCMTVYDFDIKKCRFKQWKN